MTNPLTGIGLWLWQLHQCFDGDVRATVDACKAFRARRAYLKVADGTHRMREGRAELAWALQEAGIDVWAWAYDYDAAPEAEAETLVGACVEYGMVGLIVNAEKEFNDAEGPDAQTMDRLLGRVRTLADKHAPLFQIGVSSYKFPTFQPYYPWHVLKRHGVIGMPQVYLWGRRPREQTLRAVTEWAALGLDVVTSIGSWDAGGAGHTPGQVLEAGAALSGLSEAGACRPAVDLWVLDRMGLDTWSGPCDALSRVLPERTGDVSFQCPLDTTWYRLAALARLGAYDGPLTAGWCPTTRAALRGAQAELGTVADGVWGPKTQAAVRTELTRRGLP